MLNDIALLKQLTEISMRDPNSLKKALTTTSGFAGINLQPVAKLMLPFFAGLRHRVPVTTPQKGAASAQWRMQLGFGSFNFASAMGTAAGANGSATAESAISVAATYASQSINGGVQWEAIQQALGWDNAMNIDTRMALSLLLRIEELSTLYGNTAALTMSTVTAVASTIHALPGPIFSNATWGFKVTAVTGQGALANASANSVVGESLPSVEATIAVGAGGADYIDLSWNAVPGALGYKIYVNDTANSGAWFLADPATKLAYAKPVGSPAVFTGALGDPIVVPTGQKYVTVNRVQVLAPVANTQPVPPVADGTANANMFEGMTAWSTKNTIYGQSLIGSTPRVVTDMHGLPLTTSGTGIAEFDSILQQQWVTNKISPTLIICSAQSVVSMTNKIAAAGNGSQIRLDVYKDRNNIVGGLYIGGYVNKFASGMAGMQTTIDVWAHPDMPDGTFLFIAEDVPPETYPYSQQAKTYALDVQTPYTYFELGRTDRSFPYDVFYTETLINYWPNSQSAIVGARVDA